MIVKYSFQKLRSSISYIKIIGLYNFIKYVIDRLILQKKYLSILIPGSNMPLLLRNDLSDIQTFTQIFIEKEYEYSIPNDVHTIIDCGANIGLASRFFLSKFPEARIIAIEPDLGNYKMLKQNLASFSNVVCLNNAVWSSDSDLDKIDNGWGNAGIITQLSTKKSENTVKGLSINKIISEYNIQRISVLKVDIEGSEEMLFSENLEWLNQVNLIYCEIHENLKEGITEKIKEVLIRNFEIFKHGEYHVFVSKSITC